MYNGNKLYDYLNNVLKEVPIDLFDNCILAYRNSLTKCMYSLFDCINFNNEEPNFINRNWILHGRSSRVLNEVDYFQLLSIINSLIELFNGLIVSKED